MTQIDWKQKLVLVYMLIPSFLFIASIASAQNVDGYFVQNGPIIAIEAERGIGFGFTLDSQSDASNGISLMFPKVDTLRFLSVADAYIDRYAPNTNFGTTMDLVVDGKGGMNRGFFVLPWGGTALIGFENAAFIRFNVSGLTQPIIAAKVNLFCLSGGIGGGIYSLDPNMDNMNWSEVGATWNNRPSIDCDGNTFQDYIGEVLPNTWVSFDVTQELSGKGNGEYSFGLVMQQDRPTRWSSKEGSHVPYLELFVRHSGLMVSGRIAYYDNNNPISGANIFLTGFSAQQDISDAQGEYHFANLEVGQSYIVTPRKLENSDIGPFDITTYDAAITAQAALGLRSLNSNQEIAANVNKDESITTYDAALIARYSVGLEKLPDSHVGEWRFVPESRSYSNISADMFNQDFIGILIGNVHGGWNGGDMEGQNEGLAKELLFPDYVIGKNQVFEIPITPVNENDVISMDFEAEYDSTHLQYLGLIKSSENGTEIYSNNAAGTLRIGAFNVNGFRKNEAIVRIKFRLIKTDLEKISIIVKKYRLNQTLFLTKNINVKVENSKLISDNYKLSQNYPNPFIMKSAEANTIIKYQLPEDTDIQIAIYNQLGQLVRTLINKHQLKGAYKINWDGKDYLGNNVASGIYFCQLKTPNFKTLKRIVVLNSII